MTAERITITVRPRHFKPWMFEARLGDRLLCVSETPLLTAARMLLSDGVDPATPIAMRHEGADHDALTSTVGVAAGRTVAQRDQKSPGFRSWRPRPEI